MIKKNRKYVVVLVILGIYFLIMLFLFIIPKIINRKTEITLLIGNNANWHYEDEKWEDVSNIRDYNWDKFDLYEDSTYKGNYSALFNDTWHFYDDKNTPINLESPNFLAIKTNRDYKIAEYLEKEISTDELKYVNEVLENYDINTSDFTSSNVLTYDIDSDNKEEKIFTISNVFTENFTSKIFNFIFIVKDDKITVISHTVDDIKNMYDNCKLYIDKIIDLNNDGNYEIITGCGYYSNRDTCYEMYEKVGNKYQKVKSCTK